MIQLKPIVIKRNCSTRVQCHFCVLLTTRTTASARICDQRARFKYEGGRGRVREGRGRQSDGGTDEHADISTLCHGQEGLQPLRRSAFDIYELKEVNRLWLTCMTSRDLVPEILKFVSLRDVLCSASLVCKAWLAIIREPGFWISIWKNTAGDQHQLFTDCEDPRNAFIRCASIHALNLCPYIF